MEIVYITASSLDNAKDLSEHLLNSGLIACANIFQSTSMYNWNHELKTESEYVIIIKTSNNLVSNVMEEARNRTGYEVPAMFSLQVSSVDNDYLKWINSVLLTSNSAQ